MFTSKILELNPLDADSAGASLHETKQAVPLLQLQLGAEARYRQNLREAEWDAF